MKTKPCEYCRGKGVLCMGAINKKLFYKECDYCGGSGKVRIK